MDADKVKKLLEKLDDPNVSPVVKATIKDGLEKGKSSPNELDYDEQFIEAADLGFCELFHFTCAALRTCDAWKSGGSIKKD